MADWITCNVCEEEFRVINAGSLCGGPEYCPFCGSVLELEEEDEEEDEE